MADQSDSQQGTPDADAATDWPKRYTDLQSEYTKTTQENSELRQYRELVDALQSDDPQEAAAAADALGLTFVGGVEDEEQEAPDPLHTFDQRLAAIENRFTTGDEQAALQAMQEQDADFIDAALEGLEGRLNRDLLKEEVELLVSHALVNRTEEGDPGIESAIGLFTTLDRGKAGRWVDSKRVSVPAEGQEGEEAPPGLPTHSERVAQMVEQFRANQ